MAEYQSKYTGAEIDEAVEKALSASGGSGNSMTIQAQFNPDTTPLPHYFITTDGNTTAATAENVLFALLAFDPTASGIQLHNCIYVGALTNAVGSAYKYVVIPTAASAFVTTSATGDSN